MSFAFYFVIGTASCVGLVASCVAFVVLLIKYFAVIDEIEEMMMLDEFEDEFELKNNSILFPIYVRKGEKA